MTPLTLLAPAKVNLALEVCGVLPGGYHELDTVFSWLDLADRLEVAAAERTELRVEDAIGSGIPVGSGEDNLVLRALRTLEAHVGRDLPTRFHLLRHIPAGGGLGGGSADAAAALVGVDRVHGLALDAAELHRLAAGLGSDVAFGLQGGTARGRGRGELLEPLPAPPDLPVLLLIPPFPLSTPEVYKAWDRLADPERRPGRGSAERVCEALDRGDAPALREALGNDLQPAAESLRPELRELRHAMARAGCTTTMLCGSGSTLFGLLPADREPAEAARSLEGLGTVVCTRFRRSPR